MAQCMQCESESLTEITMTMADGQVVDFTSCHRCEHKTWRTAGKVIRLDRVLALAARKK